MSTLPVLQQAAMRTADSYAHQNRPNCRGKKQHPSLKCSLKCTGKSCFKVVPSTVRWPAMRSSSPLPHHGMQPLTSKQMAPLWLLTLGCQTRVVNFIFGGTNGY